MHHDTLTKDQKVSFADRFFSAWMANGFGVMTKSETELLIFDTLRELLDPERQATNYDWSEYLRVSTSKVRRLRLDAHLRFQQGPQVLSDFLKRVQTANTTINLNGGVFDGSEIRLLVEDSAAQHELQNAVKRLGGIVHHERNREVIRLGALHFLAVVSQVEGFEEQDVILRLARHRASDDEARGKLEEMTKAAAYKNKSELEKLGHAMAVVGETFLGEKPVKLIKYVRDIVKAQKAAR